MRRFLFLLFCLAAWPLYGSNEEITIPPPQLPVIVNCAFDLEDLVAINAKNETFTADISYLFKWNDPRLAFKPTRASDIKIYLEEAAVDQLRDIWWPQIEFLHIASITYHNRALFIYPNGNVEYYISLTGDFRGQFNFMKFPFDIQKLQIKLDSFLWNKNVMTFALAEKEEEKKNLVQIPHVEEHIEDLLISTGLTPGWTLEQFGGSSEYSTYIVTIHTKSDPYFYLLQVFLPLLVIIFIQWLGFLTRGLPLLDYIIIAITTFFVFLGVKFTVNLELPHIGYMTFLDYIFMVVYIFIGIIAAVQVRQYYLDMGDPEKAGRYHKVCRWILPTAFFFTVAAVVCLSLVLGLF